MSCLEPREEINESSLAIIGDIWGVSTEIVILLQ